MQVYLTSPKINSVIIAVYEPLAPDNRMLLTGLLLPQEPLSEAQREYIFTHLCYEYPNDGKVCGVMKVSLHLEDARELVQMGERSEARKRIATYCGMYKQYFGVQYKVTPIDAKAVKSVEVDKRLLRIFFEQEFWWSKNRLTLENYCKHFNTLQLVASGEHKQSKHPHKYDPSYERALQGQGLSDYWLHLNKLGWKPQKHEVSNKRVAWVHQETGEVVSCYL